MAVYSFVLIYGKIIFSFYLAALFVQLPYVINFDVCDFCSFFAGFRSFAIMEKMPDTGPGRPLKYPYSIGAKYMQFPWKMYWKKGRGLRFLVYAILVSVVVVRPIDKFGR